MRNGILCRELRVPNRDEVIQLVVLSECLGDFVLQIMHNDAGPMGVKKSLERVRNCFYRPFMSSNVEKWCLHCERCQRRRNPVPKVRVPLKPIITTRPYEVVGMDIVEFSKSKSGNRYILVMVDLIIE